jgi:hypothetical protein
MSAPDEQALDVAAAAADRYNAAAYRDFHTSTGDRLAYAGRSFVPVAGSARSAERW